MFGPNDIKRDMISIHESILLQNQTKDLFRSIDHHFSEQESIAILKLTFICLTQQFSEKSTNSTWHLRRLVTLVEKKPACCSCLRDYFTTINYMIQSCKDSSKEPALPKQELPKDNELGIDPEEIALYNLLIEHQAIEVNRHSVKLLKNLERLTTEIFMNLIKQQQGYKWVRIETASLKARVTGLFFSIQRHLAIASPEILNLAYVYLTKLIPEPQAQQNPQEMTVKQYEDKLTRMIIKASIVQESNNQTPSLLDAFGHMIFLNEPSPHKTANGIAAICIAEFQDFFTLVRQLNLSSKEFYKVYRFPKSRDEILGLHPQELKHYNQFLDPDEIEVQKYYHIMHGAAKSIITNTFLNQILQLKEKRWAKESAEKTSLFDKLADAFTINTLHFPYSG